MGKRVLYFFLIIFFVHNASKACQCPFTTLGINECNKYEIIFKGKIVKIKECENNFGEATFEIDELYKGAATKNFKVLFDCHEVCAMKFNVGEEWIIYSRYKQIGNAKIDWCSRSRKFFKIEKQDFYTESYGNSYSEELDFLREKLGMLRLTTETKNAAENRNIRPSGNQTIIILLCSLSAIILFYWLFNKYFKF